MALAHLHPDDPCRAVIGKLLVDVLWSPVVRRERLGDEQCLVYEPVSRKGQGENGQGAELDGMCIRKSRSMTLLGWAKRTTNRRQVEIF